MNDLEFNIDPETLHRLRQSNAPHMVIDVREDWETEICALRHSFHVPLAKMAEYMDQLPKDRPLIVICHHGIRSSHAASWLRAQGFSQVMNLKGGIDAWARIIEPTMRLY